MKGVQSKINKLTLAFQMKGRIVKVNYEQFYSMKHDKVFNKITLYETCREEIKLKKKYREIKSEYKKNKCEELEKKIEKIEKRLKKLHVPSVEFKSKINLLIHMAERYKVICDG